MRYSFFKLLRLLFGKTNLIEVTSLYLDEPESKEFFKWAFGPETDGGLPIDYMVKWNRLHRSELILDQNGLISYDLPLMIEIWKKSKQ